MKERIATPTKTRQIIQKNSFAFKKGYGQNFLIDSNILDNIVSSAEITPEDFVLEIGPGIGSLTQVLAENVRRVLAVEIDSALIPILRQTLAGYDNIEILNQDILKTNLDTLIREKNDGRPIKVVATLPYYITTPILMELLEKHYPVTSLTVMVQKEVAGRMQALPGTKDYGALSVAVQYYCDAEIAMVVPPSCFMPRPKVGSAVIRLTRHETAPVEAEDEKLMFDIIRAAFNQRRKTLANGLNNSDKLDFPKETIVNVIERLGKGAGVRGEMLTLKEFAELSNMLSRISGRTCN